MTDGDEDTDDRWSPVRTRADDAYHDVAQLHLHEFAADRAEVTDRW